MKVIDSILDTVYDVYSKVFRGPSVTHRLYRLYKTYTINPNFPESEVNVVTDFSLRYGPYKNLSVAPVGSQYEKEIEKEGIIFEVRLDDTEKLILLAESEENILNVLRKEGEDIDPIAATVELNKTDCTVCGTETPQLEKLGDRLYSINPFIARTRRSSELSGACLDCTKRIFKSAINDPDVDISSENVVAKSI